MLLMRLRVLKIGDWVLEQCGSWALVPRGEEAQLLVVVASWESTQVTVMAVAGWYSAQVTLLSGSWICSWALVPRVEEAKLLV